MVLWFVLMAVLLESLPLSIGDLYDLFLLSMVKLWNIKYLYFACIYMLCYMLTSNHAEYSKTYSIVHCRQMNAESYIFKSGC